MTLQGVFGVPVGDTAQLQTNVEWIVDQLDLDRNHGCMKETLYNISCACTNSLRLIYIIILPHQGMTVIVNELNETNDIT